MRKQLIPAAVAAGIAVPSVAQVTVSGTFGVGAYETRKIRATISADARSHVQQQKTRNTIGKRWIIGDCC